MSFEGICPKDAIYIFVYICSSWHVLGVPQGHLSIVFADAIYLSSLGICRYQSIYFFKVATPAELSICVDAIYWFRSP